jgi:hypothetical protein
MQFAMHYMFESRRAAKRFFATVSTHLKTGGTFIATTADARVIVEHLTCRAEPDEQGNQVHFPLLEFESRIRFKLGIF